MFSSALSCAVLQSTVLYRRCGVRCLLFELAVIRLCVCLVASCTLAAFAFGRPGYLKHNRAGEARVSRSDSEPCAARAV